MFFLSKLDLIPATFKTALRTNSILLILTNRKVTFQTLTLNTMPFLYSKILIPKLTMVSQDKKLGHYGQGQLEKWGFTSERNMGFWSEWKQDLYSYSSITKFFNQPKKPTVHTQGIEHPPPKQTIRHTWEKGREKGLQSYWYKQAGTANHKNQRYFWRVNLIPGHSLSISVHVSAKVWGLIKTWKPSHHKTQTTASLNSSDQL